MAPAQQTGDSAQGRAGTVCQPWGSAQVALKKSPTMFAAARLFQPLHLAEVRPALCMWVLVPSLAAASASLGLVMWQAIGAHGYRLGTGAVGASISSCLLDLGNRSGCEAWGWIWKKPRGGSPGGSSGKTPASPAGEDNHAPCSREQNTWLRGSSWRRQWRRGYSVHIWGLYFL